MNYKEAEALLNGEDLRPLEYGTNLVRLAEDVIALYLHTTAIITYYSDGWIKLNSGSWRTNLTKRRMNKYLGEILQVFQKNSIWYVSPARTRSKSVDFQEEMFVRAKGSRLEYEADFSKGTL